MTDQTAKEISKTVVEFMESGGQLFATDDWHTSIPFAQIIAVDENRSLALVLPANYRLIRIAQETDEAEETEDTPQPVEGDAS